MPAENGSMDRKQNLLSTAGASDVNLVMYGTE